MLEVETIIFDQKRILELEEIIMDKDKDAAFWFLEEYVYRPIRKKRESHCKPPYK